VIEISEKKNMISSVSIKWSVRIHLVHDAVERSYPDDTSSMSMCTGWG